MLVRWAADDERFAHGFATEARGAYEVVVAVDRMSGRCLGIGAFSRREGHVAALNVMDEGRRPAIEERLRRVMEHQIGGRGGSFHFRFPEYARQAHEEFCTCCRGDPMPDGHVEVAELQHGWVIASPAAQGALFGKCVVVAKVHSVHFYDLPEAETVGFIGDVKSTARALHAVTGAVKVNYEIHGNSVPHLHCHLFPRYLDDGFAGAPIDNRVTEPCPYESEAEFAWFVEQLRAAVATT